MSATKAFDIVADAYAENSGQDKATAKRQVAARLAEVWAQDAFGSGLATQIRIANRKAEAEAQGVDPEEGDE